MKIDEVENVVVLEKLREKGAGYWRSRDKNYFVYATKGRCEGYCSLWIIDAPQRHLEYFELKFNREGIIKYRSIYGKKNFNEVSSSEKYRKISYMEALQLLGDAARQNYKYGCNLKLVESINSIHLERSWRKEWQIKNKNYILAEKNISVLELVSLYTQSLSQEDGALYYSLFIIDEEKENRDLYLHTWSHPLAGFLFQKIEIETLYYDVLAKSIQIWLVVQAKRPDNLKLELDLCLMCIHTEEGYRIEEEKVKEVRRKSC